MLKFYTPNRQGKQEPYSYRSRARLVGECIENISQSSNDDIVVLGRIHTEKDVEDLNKNGISFIHQIEKVSKNLTLIGQELDLLVNVLKI